MTLLEALKEIKRRLDCGEDLPDIKNGICINIKRIYPIEYGELNICQQIADLSKNWDKYSGSYAYPVGGQKEYYTDLDKWDKTTKYGALRRELLDFLINELEKENDL